MKLFLAIAIALALFAFAQAQEEDTSQPESSGPETTPTDLEVSDRPGPPKELGSKEWGRPPKPGRHDRRLHNCAPEDNRDQVSDDETSENNLSLPFPPRQPVFFDIKFDLGKQNIIRSHPETTTMIYAS